MHAIKSIGQLKRACQEITIQLAVYRDSVKRILAIVVHHATRRGGKILVRI